MLLCRLLLERNLSFAQLRQAHALMIAYGAQNDVTLVSYLTSAMIKIGRPSSALAVFDQVENAQDQFLWTSMIKLFSSNDYWNEALGLYSRMRAEGVMPSKFSVPFVVKACGGLRSLFGGRKRHAEVLKFGFLASDVYVQTSVLDMYVKCGEVGDARKLFDEMGVRNVVSWTAMLAGYCDLGELEKAEELFGTMPARNLVTWNVMVDGVCRFGDMEKARQYFDGMAVRNVVSWTTMIGGYSRSKDVVNARLMFDRMGEKEIVAWTAMISCYVENGRPDEAVEVFREMQAAGVKADGVTILAVISAATEIQSSDICEWVHDCVKRGRYSSRLKILNALVNMFASVGNIDKALEVFSDMPVRDVITHNSIITGCACNGYGERALSMFSKMLDSGVRPNSITFTGILTACSHCGLVDEGRKMFALMHELGDIEPKVKHYSCMVDLLGRAGFIEEAYEIILSMPIKPEPSIWGALLGACKIHGNLKMAKLVADKLFEMESGNSGNYCVLANIYSENNMWAEASGLRGTMEQDGVHKTVGSSLVESG